MVLASDSKTGATGKTLTIQLSKNGGAFAAIAPTVTELDHGWYSIALTSAMTDTVGDLLLNINAADCDPSDVRREVSNQIPTLTTIAKIAAEKPEWQPNKPESNTEDE